jgi:NADH-quinone oxidoreductase subunit L
MEVGLGAFSLAIYHLIVHGIFKATLFLESGGLIGYARHDPNIPQGVSNKLFWEENTEYKSSRTFNLIALFTVLPLIIFVGVKVALDEIFFEFNAAIVILAFAWLTGTQLFLSFFKVSKSDSIKVVLSLVSTFIIILFTYEFIGLSLEHFLYGSNAKLFYEAATINVTLIGSLVVLTLIMVVGWLFIYKQHFVEVPDQGNKPSKMKWFIYKTLAKEGYFFDIFNRSKKGKM